MSLIAIGTSGAAATMQRGSFPIVVAGLGVRRMVPAARLTVLAVLAVLAGCATAPPPSSGPAPAQPGATVPAPSSPATLPPAPVAASTVDDTPQRFAQWVGDFRVSARQSGIDERTLDAALGRVNLLPRVIELDRSQPEFTRPPWEYLDSAVSQRRVTQGQAKLEQFRIEAATAYARYGVPPAIIVAIWGMESNYGSNYGNTSTIDALATLGFEGRRGDWARGQLLAALRIIQGGDIDVSHMVGSWAGAMGQTQFLPSNFLAYAVDADGDGRRDIWSSMADVMSSTANFLARSGWQADQAPIVEVRLPQGFDLTQADPQIRLPSAQWSAMGVTHVDGGSLPDMPDTSIFLPEGARGPVFLVGPNFRAILRYNNSTSYALAVSLLAQSIMGGPGVQAAWPRDLVNLSRSQLTDLQTGLNARGFDTGTPDGMMGPATRTGLRRYQQSIGLPPDGYPTLDLLQRLQATIDPR